MSQATLPLEIHEHIINVIGNEYSSSKVPPYGQPSEVVRGTLEACSLVCKDWHSLTLRHTFYIVNITFREGNEYLKRHAELCRILEINPSIRKYMRRTTAVIVRHGVLPEDVEPLRDALSLVVTSKIVLQCSEDRFDLPRPLAGLHAILTGRNLCDLSIFAISFPLILLENLTNLRSLTLIGVRTLDLVDVDDRTWRSELSTLEKLVVQYSRGILSQLGAAVEEFVGPFAFFKNVKYLVVDLDSEAIDRDPPWRVLLARWTCLETLVIGWDVHTKGQLVSIPFFSPATDVKLPFDRKSGQTI